MMRRFFLYSLLCCLLLGYSEQANAQFWKKIFKKEQPRRRPPVKKTTPKEKQPTKSLIKKKQEIDYPETVTKPRYRIDVLVQLYLSELVVDGKPVSKGKFPDKVVPGMDFYEGVKLAADSLNTSGYNIDVYVHDITDGAHRPDMLIAKRILDSSDLIIGAIPSQYIPQLAQYAAKKEINFVSALSPSDADVKNNPYYILTQPSLRAHCKWIAERVAKKHRKQNAVLYYRTSVPVDKEAYEYLTLDKDNEYKELVCNSIPTRQQLQKLFDSTETNVLVMGIIDNSYSETLLGQLDQWFPGYKFEVYGMPSWRSLSGLKKTDNRSNIAINITTPFYFDMTTASGQSLSNSYKTAFGGAKPGEMVYRGYETMYLFAYLLGKYGTIFNEKLKDSGVAPFTRYELKPDWDKDGNLLYIENKHIYLQRYQDGSFSVDNN